jgi:hypothetical protein
VLTVVLVAGPALAGSHRASGVDGGPVGRHEEGDKIGSEGNVTAGARSSLTWADNRTSVTLEDGLGDARFCAPGDCVDDGRSTVPADRLVIQNQFVVWGKEVAVTRSGSASVSKGGPQVSVERSDTTSEKMITVTWVHDAGARGETTQSVSGIRIDGKGISRADHVVLATAERHGEKGHAEARTTTYLR